MKNLLLLVVMLIAASLKTEVLFSQDFLEIDKSKIDTSKRAVRRITNLSVYYLEQMKKTDLPQAEYDNAREYLFKAERELKEIDKMKINNAKFKLDKAFLIEAKKERDAKLTEIASTPQGYFSAEERSINIGAFVGITGAKYTKPVAILVEYNVVKRWTGGVWVGYFMEQKQVHGSFDGKIKSYGVGESNYKFDYITVGVKGKYHFFNPVRPLFGLPMKYLHFYVAAGLGYNLALKPRALQNDTDVKDNPSKAGLAYGIWPGIHYQMDEHLGFDLEAGYGNLGIVKLGLNWRLFMSKPKIEVPQNRNNSFN